MYLGRIRIPSNWSLSSLALPPPYCQISSLLLAPAQACIYCMCCGQSWVDVPMRSQQDPYLQDLPVHLEGPEKCMHVGCMRTCMHYLTEMQAGACHTGHA